MHVGALALCGAGAVSALVALFLMGTNDVATIAAIGPPAISVAITAMFEVAGISIASGTIENSLPNRAALVFQQAPASTDGLSLKSLWTHDLLQGDISSFLEYHRLTKIGFGWTVPSNFFPAALSFLSVLISIVVVVGIGTGFSVPVATMHACIGSLVGVALLSSSSRGVSWPAIADVVVSWALSPILGGVFAVGGRYALRLASSSHSRYKTVIPLIAGFSFCATVSLVAVSAPRWLLRRWIPGNLAAAVVIFVLFGSVSAVTAGFMRRNAGASVASVQIYNLTEDEDTWDQDGEEASLAPKGESSDGPAEFSGPAEVFVMDTAELSGAAEESDLDVEDEDWAGAQFVVDERAPVFRLLLAGTTAGIAFAQGSTDIAYTLAPLAAILRYYQTISSGSSVAPLTAGLSTSAVPTDDFVSNKESALLDGELAFPVFFVAAGAVLVGLCFGGSRIMSTVNNVNKRSKLSFARSFSVHLATVLTLLLTKYLGLPVSVTYCIVASQAVSSVAYLPASERALERVHEGLDLRLLMRMVVLAAIAPAGGALVAVCSRLSLGIIFT